MRTDRRYGGSFAFNSSGELKTVGDGGAAGSTQVSVSGYSTNVSVSGYSTIVNVSGGTLTVSPAAGSTFVVRSIAPDSTFKSGVAGTSGDVALLTSAATQIYVYGINLGWGGIMTSNTKQVLRMQSGTTGAEMCRACFQISNIGADASAPVCLAVTPPAYLGRTAAGESLNLNATSSGAVYSVFAWRE